MENTTIALATAAFTGLLVLINICLIAVSLRAANAAKTNADVMSRDFRLARMPVVLIEWSDERAARSGGNSLIARGSIVAATDTTMFLSKIGIETSAYPHTSGVVRQVTVASFRTGVIINRQTRHNLPAVRFEPSYRAQQTETVGEIRVTLSIEPMGIPEHKETFTMISTVISDGSIGQSYREHEEQHPRPSRWQRWCEWQDRIRREMGGPECPRGSSTSRASRSTS